MVKLLSFFVTLEKQLHDPQVRRDLARLEQLLAEDFIEIGASGRRYTRADILKFLPEADGHQIHAFDFELRPLADDLVLLIYRTQTEDSHQGALRSSLWRRQNGRWRMVFHQGTLTRGA